MGVRYDKSKALAEAIHQRYAENGGYITIAEVNELNGSAKKSATTIYKKLSKHGFGDVPKPISAHQANAIRQGQQLWDYVNAQGREHAIVDDLSCVWGSKSAVSAQKTYHIVAARGISLPRLERRASRTGVGGRKPGEMPKLTNQRVPFHARYNSALPVVRSRMLPDGQVAYLLR